MALKAGNTQSANSFLGKFLSCKVQSIVSFLYILWIAKLLFPLKNSKKLPTVLAGLQTVIHLEPKQPPHPTHGASILHRYSTIDLTKVSKRSSPLSSPMFQSSVIGDLIGAESGDNMSSNVEELKGSGQMDVSEEAYHSKRSRVIYRNAMTKKYPPPMTLLGQTGNLPGRMPWVFKREYSDGRLVIRAERFKRHEYLEGHRENGRLIMRLVPADDTVYCDECGEPFTVNEEEGRELEALEEEETEHATGSEKQDDEEEVALASETSSSSQKPCLEDESGHEPCGNLRKRFPYPGEMGQDSDPLCKGNGTGLIGVGNGFLGQPGSSPIRPMTVVR